MSGTTPLRERVLHLIREERTRQVEQYGSNAELALGFGGTVASPWLAPFSHAGAEEVERRFRHDYELQVHVHGEPTWMHLIREEVAELFEATHHEHVIAEAIQVAALCTSLVELLITDEGGTP